MRKDERGQVLSSLVAVVAVVAVVGGLLVLFGTRGSDSVADDAKPAAQTPSAPATTPAGKPTAAPSTKPTVEPTPSRTPTEPMPTETTPSEPADTPTSTPTDPAGTEPTEQPTSSVSVPPSQRPAVEIYNNTTRKGLAQSVGNRARQAGWSVSGADNWRGKVATSTVYYPAGMQTEAAQLAQDLGVARIKDALDNMKKDRLTVILTADYAG
ncbi:hypothetical protein Kfla_1219 [Kribbella flavida DSM 17836]|uniref:LytR/CpsA/Psr regulator C-terminal domain-containing protein n=1 Tax=Kribbella flavida (strain DSM 17836 / JCM 10339 / NBRC 14399) TaxID=479435 RepID=D2Q408_KRIFD|nr:LytR C-terminal domain-containing protein [Kribbella flavida]ADB30322.1 hypothetical protein Kfla_1219 [Kribbella flavida DSM 17836]